MGALVFFVATLNYAYLGRERFMVIFGASLVCSVVGIVLWYHGMVRGNPVARLNIGKKLAFAGILLVPICAVPLSIYSECGACLLMTAATMIAAITAGLPIYVLCCSASGHHDRSGTDTENLVSGQPPSETQSFGVGKEEEDEDNDEEGGGDDGNHILFEEETREDVGTGARPGSRIDVGELPPGAMFTVTDGSK